ncbi:MAG: KamA family radical SAM protein [Planctomycetota bacterium]
MKVKYVTKIEQLKQLSERERAELKEVADKFDFRVNDYYLSLIDWDDPEDPIRRIVIPNRRELEEWGRLDPSNEKRITIMPGLEHKYHSVVLFLVTNKCEGICRYCFRKRIFIEPERESIQDWDAAYRYVSEHAEVTNVLLTGGDPLTLATSKLEEILRRLREIDHVQIIRIGTRMTSYNPYRIIDDPALLEAIAKYSTDKKKIYVVTHFVHPRELTDVAVEGVHLLQKAGAMMANQTPLIKGLSDNPDVLAELLRKLSFIGVPPYYIFQCRPALGNKAYTVPIEQGYEIVEQAKAQVSGLAKRARYAMSHSSGKIEIVGKTEGLVYFKYHRAAKDADSGRFMVFKSNPNACWFDDYNEAVQDYPISLPCMLHGPK